MKIVKGLSSLISWFPHPKLQYYLKHHGQVIQLKAHSGAPIWIHASSGELEYARSLIREIRALYPEVPLLVTHTSLSSLSQLKKLDVHFIGVLPIDEKKSVEVFLKRINPRALLVARTDLWPEIILQLKQKQIPTFLFSATFATGSRKSSALSSYFLKPTIHNLSHIYFVSSEDQKVCEKNYGITSGQILGDTRYDQAVFRLQNSAPSRLPLYEKLIVAGSTWPEDDEILIQSTIRMKADGWKWIWVPHEISGPQIENLKTQLIQQNLKFQLYSAAQDLNSWDQIDVLLVDEMGILATLYPLAQVSFVGGSFKKQVHSVMEPLAAGSPVLVGPFHHNNREAIEFKALGWVLEARDSDEFVKGCQKLHRQANKNILSEVKSRCGATKRLIASLQTQSPLIFK